MYQEKIHKLLGTVKTLALQQLSGNGTCSSYSWQT